MVKVHELNGTATKEIVLPKVFSTPYRPDVIQRAVLAIQANSRQPYGKDPEAGFRTSAYYRSRRDAAHSMMNHELGRVSRTANSSPQQEMRARRAPQTVKGFKAHAPLSSKVWKQKINAKENVLAIKSAIAASCLFDLVSKRHKISKMNLPIIMTDELESVKKTKDLENILIALKLGDDLERAKIRKVRAGRGKMRGRKYKKKKSFLFVVANDKGIIKAASNIAGIDICNVKNLNAELLAPGTHAGRLTIWTESSVKKIGEIYG